MHNPERRVMGNAISGVHAAVAARVAVEMFAPASVTAAHRLSVAMMRSVIQMPVIMIAHSHPAQRKIFHRRMTIWATACSHRKRQMVPC